MKSNIHRTVLERLLGISTRLRPAEGKSVTLFFAYAFLLLLCYYTLKTVREPLLLAQVGSAEVKSYAYATTALVLLLFIPLYGVLFRHINKRSLVRAITLFFSANLVILALIGWAGVDIGFIYYVWVGVFSVTILAQFWAYAADSYNVKSGQRLFPLIMAGATLGGLAGPPLAGWLFPLLGAWNLMLGSAVLLLATLPFIGPADQAVPAGSRSLYPIAESEPPGLPGGLALVKRDRYLLLLAVVAVLLNWINTTGEYILAELVVRHANGIAAVDGDAIKSNIIAEFYADYFLAVNAITVLFQLFLVSRLFRWIGVRGTILILPAVALLGYGLVVFVPIFSIIRVVKILENSTEYSIFNTARQALFLPLTESQKYEGKMAIDAFFWRVGDVVQAVGIYLGLNWFGFALENFAAMNIVLALAWIMITLEIGRLFAAKEQQAPANTPPRLLHPLEATPAPPGQAITVELPSDTFEDPDPGDLVTVTVTKQDGRPLPSWLEFDRQSLTLSGRVPASQKGNTTLLVRAKDFDGAVCETRLVLCHRPEKIPELKRV